MIKTLVAASCVFMLVGLGACKGSAEKTGENLDTAVENATQGHKNSGDGALEKTGESIDKATNNGQNKDKDPMDSLHDATDGDKSTKP